MKYTLSAIAMSSALYAFNTHAMFQFQDSTAQQITTTLERFKKVANDNQMNDNPVAHIYTSMQDTIAKDGLSALVAQQAVNTQMKKMHDAYKTDSDYKTALKHAKAMYDPAQYSNYPWWALQQNTIRSLITVTQENSSFKCQTQEQCFYNILSINQKIETEDGDLKPILDTNQETATMKHILDINQKAKIEDGDIWKATTLMLFYQMQECTGLLEEAANDYWKDWAKTANKKLK